MSAAAPPPAPPRARGDDDHPVLSAWRLLEQLVRIPSPTGDTEEVAHFLVDWGRAHGLHAGLTPTGAPWLSTTPDPFTAEADIERPHLLFFGHVDTVPGMVPVRQVDVRVGGDPVYSDAEGPLLWGRGSVDAKGSLAVACATLADAAARGTFPGTCTVVAAVDEEGDSATAHWAAERIAVPPDAVVVGEPSGSSAVTLGYKGRIGLRVVFEAEVAHGGAPVPSAADRLVAWLAGLGARLATVAGAAGSDQGPMFDRVTHKVTALDTTGDGLMQRAEAHVDVRLPPGVVPEAVVEALSGPDEATAGEADKDADVEAGDAAGAGPALFVEDMVAAHVSDKRSRLVAAFNAALRAHDMKPRHLRKTGTADLCILAPAWPRAACVVYGPGASILDHTPEERVSFEEVAAAVRVYADAFAAWYASASRDERS